MFKKTALILLAFFLVVTTASAQLSETGALVGKVKDSEGLALPGVTVSLKSPAIILPEMATVTNELGLYRFPQLSPGIYELSFVLSGFNTFIHKDIKVSVGQTTTIDVVMQVKSLAEEIVVTGQTPTVDLKTTTKNVSLETVFLTSIPAIRDLAEYVNMTPGFTADTSHGSSVRDNTYNLDGVNLGDPTVGTQAVFFGIDLMEEISVQSGGLSAEFGGVRGAVINVVSKSGGNTFSGNASFYFRNKSLQASNVAGTPLEGSKSGFKYEIEPTLTLGGPIIKDRLWFFTNLSFVKDARYVSGFPYDKEDNVAVDSFMPYPYIKFSYQPNQDNKFVLSYNYSDIIYHNRGASRYQTEDTTWNQKTPTHVFNFHWTRFFSSSFFTNLKIGYVKSDFNMLAKSDDPSYIEYTTRRYSGSAGYDDLNKRDRLQINADATRYIDSFIGSHELKFGGEFMYSWSVWGLNFRNDPRNGMSTVYNYYGIPFYGIYYADLEKHENTMNMAAFVQDAWTIGNRLTLNLGLRFEHQRGIIPPQNQAEGEQDFYGYTYNRSVTSTITALKWTTLAPRLGVVYDVTGDGKTLIKGSFARYYAANLTQWFTYLNPNDFVYGEFYLYDDGTPMFPTYISVPGTNRAGYGDHKLKNPYLDELTIGIEREVGADLSVGARYIRKWDRDLIEDVNASQLDIDALMNRGELNWIGYEQVTAIDPYTNEPVTFYNQTEFNLPEFYTVNPPGCERNYHGFEFTLTKRFTGKWGLMASYIWQKSEGLVGTDFDDSYGARGYFDDPNYHINAYGRMKLERRNQFKLEGMYRAPWGIIISGYFRYLSGQRYSRIVNSYDLGLELNQGDVDIYAEPRGSYGLPALAILDLRLEKTFQLKKIAFSVFADGFNVFNNNKSTEAEELSSNPAITFGEMLSIQAPRIIRLGAKVSF